MVAKPSTAQLMLLQCPYASLTFSILFFQDLGDTRVKVLKSDPGLCHCQSDSKRVKNGIFCVLDIQYCPSCFIAMSICELYLLRSPFFKVKVTQRSEVKLWPCDNQPRVVSHNLQKVPCQKTLRFSSYNRTNDSTLGWRHCARGQRSRSKIVFLHLGEPVLSILPDCNVSMRVCEDTPEQLPELIGIALLWFGNGLEVVGYGLS